MPRTTAIGDQIRDGSIQRVDLDAATPGAAVVRRLIAGSNVTLTSTGPDSGTGDVTINAAGGGSATPINWVGGTSGALPAAPATNTVQEASYAFAELVRPVLAQSNGDVFSAQPNLAQRAVYIVIATPVTAVSAIGIAVSLIGTGTTRAISASNATWLLAARRVGFVSAATVGALAGVRSAQAFLYLGNAVDRGGFYSFMRFGIGAITADSRMFFGLSANTAAPTNVEPNTINNSVGIGKIAGSANMQFITRNTAAATTTDLGVNFPASANAAYEVGFFALPNSAAINAYVRRLDSPQYVEFLNVTTNSPTVNTLLTFSSWICNNATASAVSLDIMSMYAEAAR